VVVIKFMNYLEQKEEECGMPVLELTLFKLLIWFFLGITSWVATLYIIFNV